MDGKLLSTMGRFAEPVELGMTEESSGRERGNVVEKDKRTKMASPGNGS